MSKSPLEILFLTRPWEMDLHLALEKKILMNNSHANVKFVTFYWRAYRILSKKGKNVEYFPDLLRSVVLNSESKAELDCIVRKIEKQNGLTIHQMMRAERFFKQQNLSCDEFIYRHLKVIKTLVSSKMLCIGSMVDHFVYWCFAEYCELVDAAFVGFVDVGFPQNYCVALKNAWTVWSFDEMPKDQADEVLRVAKERLNLPLAERLVYMAKKKTSYKNRINEWYQRYSDSKEDQKRNSYFISQKNLLRQSFATKINFKQKMTIDQSSDNKLPIISDNDYFFIPLHYEPEGTVSVWSPWIFDQISAIEMVAASLSPGQSIIVKENPKMIGKRDREFYRRIMEIPSVSIVDPHINTISIIKRSRATISLAGTACLESIALGVPSVFLGRPPYRNLASMCDIGASCFTPHELRENLKYLSCDNLSKNWHSWIACCLHSSVQVDGCTNQVPSDNQNISGLYKCLDYIINMKAGVYP